MPSPEPRRILVVGGVAGGMSFAARARRLDERAEIVVFERGLHPSFANCGLPYFVSGEIERERALLVQTPGSLRAALNLDVRVGHEVTAIDPAAQTITVRAGIDEFIEPYDELVLAPGAASLKPVIPGIASPAVHLLRTVEDALALRTAELGGRRAVVLGGGYIGVEAAEALRMRGAEVHLVQRGPHPLRRLETELASLMVDELHANGVQLHAGTSAREVREASRGAVTVVLEDGTEIDADVVVVAIGTKPDTAFATGLGITDEEGFLRTDANGRTDVPHIWAVGDAAATTDPDTGARRHVALAGPANRNGRLLADAMMLGDAARPQPAPLGTSVVRVFGLTAAMVGATRAELVASGTAFETLHVHAGSHAGYFPGAHSVHLVVHFSADPTEDGRLLGAQAAGRDGIDKRIDVLATAMRAGVGVADLMDLDLAYAPPYGAAKDPITMVGLVGDNVLTGATTLWHAEELADVQATSLILDVRRDDEWATGHLPGALHIPHTELRDRMDEVRAAANGRPVRIHCASGVRSYLAHRQLAVAGFDSATLSGGMQTLLAYHGKDILTHEDH